MLRKFVFILISIMLAVSMSVSACADAAELQWGMSMADVIGNMGEPCLKDEQAMPGLVILEYDDESLLRPKTDLLICMFKDDALVGYEYMIYGDDADMTKYKAMGEALDAEYGESTDEFGPMANLYEVTYSMTIESDYFDNIRNAGIPYEYKTWKDVNGAEVVLWCTVLGDQAVSTIVYLQPSSR